MKQKCFVYCDEQSSDELFSFEQIILRTQMKVNRIEIRHRIGRQFTLPILYVPVASFVNAHDLAEPTKFARNLQFGLLEENEPINLTAGNHKSIINLDF